MRLWTIVLATLAFLTPLAASAQPVRGPYVSLGAGVGLQQDEVGVAAPSLGLPVNRFWSFHPGFSGNVSFGYGLGNGLRAEIEGDFLTNDVYQYAQTSSRIATGSERKYGGLVNLLYDFKSIWGVNPYLGLGAGGQVVEEDGRGQYLVGSAVPPGFGRGSASTSAFAYQGIAGVALPITGVAGLSLTMEYRFLGLVDPYPGVPLRVFNFNGTVVATGTHRYSNDYNHSILLGLRYALYQPAPPPVPAVSQPAAPTPEVARTYLVFFDWDRADITDRARTIIAGAAQASTRVQVTRIEVNGYTDLSGTAQYNQGLSLRRARAVAAELVRNGVPQTEIDIHGFGETHPLVPTAQGVREPQNRRVEILMH